jgi:hypothetical protein
VKPSATGFRTAYVDGAILLCGLASAATATFLLLFFLPDLRCGRGDFLAFYAGAKLLGTPSLYSAQAIEAVQRQLLDPIPSGTLFIRFPAYAAVWKPLSDLPYYFAYLCFQGLSLLLMAWIALRSGTWPLRLCFMTFLPLAAGLFMAQDIALVVALSLGFAAASSARKDWLAGLALAACALKPHLFMLAPLVLLFHRRWRIIGGAAIGMLAWLLASTALQPGWLRPWWNIIRTAQITPQPEKMPTINGLVAGYGLPPAAGAVLYVCVLAAVLYAAWKQPNLERAFAVAIAGGLLLSPHAYVYDCAILIPLIGYGLRNRNSAVPALLALSPLPYAIALLWLPTAGPLATFWLIAASVDRGPKRLERVNP